MSGGFPLNPLEMAVAHEYARREYERRHGKKRAPKNRKNGWRFLLWLMGFGFLIGAFI
jgi:hypothetical protein